MAQFWPSGTLLLSQPPTGVSPKTNSRLSVKTPWKENFSLPLGLLRGQMTWSCRRQSCYSAGRAVQRTSEVGKPDSMLEHMDPAMPEAVHF